jgi:transposase
MAVNVASRVIKRGHLAQLPFCTVHLTRAGARHFHVLPCGFAGPSLLAMILFEKYGQHQPLNLNPSVMRVKAWT